MTAWTGRGEDPGDATDSDATDSDATDSDATDRAGIDLDATSAAVVDGDATDVDGAGRGADDAADREDDEDAADREDDEDDPTDVDPVKARAEAPPSRTRRALVPGLLTLVAALLVAAGIVLLVQAHNVRTGADSSNQAVVDQVATTQVIGEVSQTLNQVLSYDYTDPSATQKAAAALLTGDAASQYATLFTALQSKAPGEQLTLTAKTVSAGVTTLSGSTAQLLVFLDQTSTRASDKATSSSAAQLQVTAVKQGDNWKISELLPL